MMPLTDEENKSYEEQEVCHIFKKRFCLDEDEDENKSKQITKKVYNNIIKSIQL